MDVEILRGNMAATQTPSPAHGAGSHGQPSTKPAKNDGLEPGEYGYPSATRIFTKEEGAPSGKDIAGPAKEYLIKDAVDNANKVLITSARKLSYSIHEKTKKVMVTVINAETEEVIREIPPEKVLDHYAKMLELTGLLVDERS